MVNVCGTPQLIRPSSFSAKSQDRRLEIGIASRLVLREFGDCEPSVAAFLGEYGAVLLLHRCPKAARKQIHLPGMDWLGEGANLDGWDADMIGS
jgi:hypothetical protein